MDEVTSGRLKPADAFPSEQQLTKTLKVTRNTVRQAMGELARDGFVRRIPDKGTFVSDRNDAKTRLTLLSFGSRIRSCAKELCNFDFISKTQTCIHYVLIDQPIT